MATSVLLLWLLAVLPVTVSLCRKCRCRKRAFIWLPCFLPSCADTMALGSRAGWRWFWTGWGGFFEKQYMEAILMKDLIRLTDLQKK